MDPNLREMYRLFFKRTKMKKILIILVLLAWWGINARGVVNNPEISLDEKIGRTVYLKKIAVAHDDGGTFIFKRPHDILAVENGSFFLIDNGQVLKFNAEGKFSKVIVKKGEGPGEATHLYETYGRNADLIINTGFMNKLMVFDFDGKLKEEFKQVNIPTFTKKSVTVGSTTFQILGHQKNKNFIVLCNAYPGTVLKKRSELKNTFIEKPVMLLSEKNEWLKQLFGIPLKSVVLKTQLRTFLHPVLSPVYSSNERFIFFSNTERYEIKRYNISENKIDASWKRKYQPFPMPAELKGKMEYGGVVISGSRKSGKNEIHKAPEKDFLIDIKKIVVVESYVWVMTSTIDRQRGILIDVFDEKGEYLDNFYLSPPGEVNVFDFYMEHEIHIYKGFLFMRQADEDGNPIIVKYKIAGPKLVEKDAVR